MEALRAAANDCELYRKARWIVDLQVGLLARLVAGNLHQTLMLFASVQFPNTESNPRPHGRSNGGLGACVTVGGGVGESPNRQGAALFNQGIDLLNHGIAAKTECGVRLELARRRRQ